MIASDEDADASGQRPERGILHERGLKVATPSYPYPMPVCNNATGFSAESRQQLTPDEDNALPSPVSLESNPGRMLEAATSLPSRHTADDLALVDVLPNAQYHMLNCSSDVEPRTVQAGSGPAGWTKQNTNRSCKASGQASKTNVSFILVTWHS